MVVIMKKKSVKGLLCVAVMILLVVFFYKYTSNLTDEQKEKTANTELEKLLALDLQKDKDYPKDPKETVTLYSRILQCLYKGNFKEEEIERLAKQICYLFDEELLANNKESEYFASLKEEVSQYKKEKITINTYKVEDLKKAKSKVIEGKECTTIRVRYTLKEKKEYNRTYEQFILRKDDSGKWKILGWQKIDEFELESEE